MEFALRSSIHEPLDQVCGLCPRRPGGDYLRPAGAGASAGGGFLVIERAGANTPSLVEHGLELAREKKFGAEALLRQAVQPGNLSASIELSQSLTNLVDRIHTWNFWGSPEPRLENLLTISRGTNGLAGNVYRIGRSPREPREGARSVEVVAGCRRAGIAAVPRR